MPLSREQAIERFELAVYDWESRGADRTLTQVAADFALAIQAETAREIAATQCIGCSRKDPLDFKTGFHILEMDGLPSHICTALAIRRKYSLQAGDTDRVKGIIVLKLKRTCCVEFSSVIHASESCPEISGGTKCTLDTVLFGKIGSLFTKCHCFPENSSTTR